MVNRIDQTVFVCSALLLFLPVAGCNDGKSSADAVVQGTVTIDGVLAQRGQVTFHPVGGGPIATGPIHEDGSFSLRIGQGNMANPDESLIYSGEYVATVIVNEPADKTATVGEGGPPLAGKRLTAIKYSRKETSDLKFSVKAGRNVFAIELEGSQNDPLPEVVQTEETTETPAADEAAEASDGDTAKPEADALPAVEEPADVKEQSENAPAEEESANE